MAGALLARRFRAVARLSRTTVHIVHGMAIALLRFPRMSEAARAVKVQWWSIKLLRLMGVGLTQSGSPRPGAKLLVANHISWLDIMAVHSVCPQARFVSKSDVRQWPLLGALVAAAGTLFIERERKRDALRVVHRMAEALTGGETVAIFPEGTTSDGTELLPFHANLLQAAIATEVPIQSVVLDYGDAFGAPSQAVSFVGDTTLLQSLWWIACAEQLQVRVRLLPARSVRHADRRRLAESLRAEIEACLRGVDLDSQSAAVQPLP